MTILEAILLGLIRGAAEFFPVSSSGHLILSQQLFGLPLLTPLFTIAMHFGVLLAAIFALHQDIWLIIRKPFQRMSIIFILTIIITIVLGSFLRETLITIFGSGQWLGPSFLATSAAIFVAEYFSRKPGHFRTDAELGFRDALLIGFLQTASLIIPGASRSGLALSAALFRKLNRNLAARFVFLLSIPIIISVLIVELRDLHQTVSFLSVNPDATDGFLLAGSNLVALIAGGLSAMVTAFTAITIMIALVSNHSIAGFGVYTTIVGIFVLVNPRMFF